jgi:hypothetical protein
MSREIKERALTNQLSWQTGKHLIRQFTGTDNPPTEKLMNGLWELKDWFSEEFSTAQKMEIIEQRHAHRANRLRRCDWEFKSCPIDDLGTVLPETGDLPPEVITEPLPAVVEYVEEQIEGSGSRPDSVVYISELAGSLGIVEEFPPLSW